jgi:hypothetical protein
MAKSMIKKAFTPIRALPPDILKLKPAAISVIARKGTVPNKRALRPFLSMFQYANQANLKQHVSLLLKEN